MWSSEEFLCSIGRISHPQSQMYYNIIVNRTASCTVYLLLILIYTIPISNISKRSFLELFISFLNFVERVLISITLIWTRELRFQGVDFEWYILISFNMEEILFINFSLFLNQIYYFQNKLRQKMTEYKRKTDQNII